MSADLLRRGARAARAFALVDNFAFGENEDAAKHLAVADLLDEIATLSERDTGFHSDICLDGLGEAAARAYLGEPS